MVKEVIEYLYISNTPIVIMAYLPQIWVLCTSKTACKDISLLAWSVFVLVNFNVLLYAVFILNDSLAIVLAVVQVLLHATVLGITIYKRFFKCTT